MTFKKVLNKIQFAKECGFNLDDWKDRQEEVDNVLDIYNDYIDSENDLNNIAQGLSLFVQKMDRVHSVRWRLKAPVHLVRKIFRKKLNGSAKYKDITVENYKEKVTDLIGVRVLHLYKGDFVEIHKNLSETWNFFENPVAYVRDGDEDYLRQLYRDLGLSVEVHSDGYRSIHYIVETNFTKSTVLCEIQVRTIFEEGWSEVDHGVRYPEFSKDPILQEFLHVFNRISGAADEMGTFVHRLSNHLNFSKKEMLETQKKSDEMSLELREKLVNLENLGKKNNLLTKEISELRVAMQKRDEYQKIANKNSIGALSLGGGNGLTSSANALNSIGSVLGISGKTYREAMGLTGGLKTSEVLGIGAASKPKK